MGDKRHPRRRETRRRVRKALNGLHVARNLGPIAATTIGAVRAGTLTASRACDEKARFSRRWAERQAAAMRRDTKDVRYSAYPCPFCRGYHVGKNTMPNAIALP